MPKNLFDIVLNQTPTFYFDDVVIVVQNDLVVRLRRHVEDSQPREFFEIGGDGRPLVGALRRLGRPRRLAFRDNVAAGFQIYSHTLFRHFRKQKVEEKKTSRGKELKKPLKK